MTEKPLWWLRMLWCMLAHDWSKRNRPSDSLPADLFPYNYCETCRGFVVDLYGRRNRGSA